MLCFSQKLYIEATYSQRQEEWLLSVQNAFYYFGGVIQTLGFDNAKALVGKSDRYDPDINPELLKFSEHFKTAPIPAQVRAPTHKALMENHLGILEVGFA